MAFSSGIHVACGSIGERAEASLVVNLLWSQTMPSSGTTTQVAGNPANMFEIAAAVDAWIAIGPTPDATQTTSTGANSARILVRAGETRNLFANPGDRVAWIAA